MNKNNMNKGQLLREAPPVGGSDVFRGKRSGSQEMQLAQFQWKRWPKQARGREMTWTVVREKNWTWTRGIDLAISCLMMLYATERTFELNTSEAKTNGRNDYLSDNKWLLCSSSCSWDDNNNHHHHSSSSSSSSSRILQQPQNLLKTC